MRQRSGTALPGVSDALCGFPTTEIKTVWDSCGAMARGGQSAANTAEILDFLFLWGLAGSGLQARHVADRSVILRGATSRCCVRPSRAQYELLQDFPVRSESNGATKTLESVADFRKLPCKPLISLRKVA
jgi:hypothetical protein